MCFVNFPMKKTPYYINIYMHTVCQWNILVVSLILLSFLFSVNYMARRNCLLHLICHPHLSIYLCLCGASQRFIQVYGLATPTLQGSHFSHSSCYTPRLRIYSRQNSSGVVEHSRKLYNKCV